MPSHSILKLLTIVLLGAVGLSLVFVYFLFDPVTSEPNKGSAALREALIAAGKGESTDDAIQLFYHCKTPIGELIRNSGIRSVGMSESQFLELSRTERVAVQEEIIEIAPGLSRVITRMINDSLNSNNVESQRVLRELRMELQLLVFGNLGERIDENASLVK